MSELDKNTIDQTRNGLHALSEHLLAGDLWAKTGRIGLRQTYRGIGQPEIFDKNVRNQLRVEDNYLVVLEGVYEKRVELTTLNAAAEFAGVQVQAPVDVYKLETDPDPAADLQIGPVAAAALFDFLGVAGLALERFRALEVRVGQRPSIIQFWPEHFDLSFAMEEINFGVSLGDPGTGTPYVYVGPWTQRSGTFWNQPYGASLEWQDISSVDDIVEFYQQGFELAVG